VRTTFDKVPCAVTRCKRDGGDGEQEKNGNLDVAGEINHQSPNLAAFLNVLPVTITEF